MRVTSIALLTAIFPLAGCYERNTSHPTRTVSWYLEHRAELETTLDACLDNPGTLNQTPNCVNANEARNKLTVQEMENALK